MKSVLVRLAPLAGVVFAALTLVAYGSISKFPDGDAPAATLSAYYHDHHAQLRTGGVLLAWATALFIPFAVAAWHRMRDRSPVAAAAALVGATVFTTGQIIQASAYATLSHVATHATVSQGALQAWHLLGSEPFLPVPVGLAVFLLGGAIADGLTGWLRWSAVLIGVVQLTPFAFAGSLVFLAWAALAGIMMAIRPPVPAETAQSARPVPAVVE